MTQYVYSFGGGVAQGSGAQKELLGGKGAGLAEMTRLGIPVPPGFTISTEVCRWHYDNGRRYPDGLDPEVRAAMKRVEELVGAGFGDAHNPLLVSVRSGARVSMPGMMDTVLNLGLNDTTVEGLAARTNDRRFAYDAYRRFVQMYGDVVLDLKPETKDERDPFEVLLEAKKEVRHARLDTDLKAEDLQDLVKQFKAEILRRTGKSFPEDPWEQLWGAVRAVFGSWENPRAITYRKMYGIPSEWGTAVTVQGMVFGNMGQDSATGVAFTRDPSTGEKRFFGEYLVNAQGEDVVAGIRTPSALTRAARKPGDPPSLEELMPAAYAELERIYQGLEAHYHDMQDIEFTIQRGKLWLLQTRNGKRTARAMVRIAVEMVREGKLTPEEAVLRQDPAKIEELLHPALDPQAHREIIAKGLPASPGAATGKVVFHADDAEAAVAADPLAKVILVRIETSPEDIHGMKAAQGILTARGGMTSHAAVVARGMGKCCVAGCGALHIDYAARTLTVTPPSGGPVVTLRQGDVLTLDGTRGEVIVGAVPMIPARLDADFATLMEWVDARRRLRVRTNADTPTDARTARAFGAEGIGLCRTEHMFFEPDRILAVRQMILAQDEASRRRALEKILPMQRGDFLEILRAMEGLPVTVRLLDPPLHEFLPHTDAEIRAVASELGVRFEEVAYKNQALHEFNPMLGHRGCRLAVTYPEIYEVQTQAIMEAACELARQGVDVRPEIMIPIVGTEQELELMRRLVVETAEKVLVRVGVRVAYTVGTMIELPRACVVAGRIAEHADFFSFGTNDLTQTTLGISRDDAGRFIPDYLEKKIYARDPFVSIDREGVGELMRTAVRLGRGVKDKLKLGICGEHGGDPSSVEFCHELGLDYVSCSPFRVPIARLAAAQAALREAKRSKAG
ncbi:MAG TPA: pyruvate, phosphate dikinase [Polyangia bacterium]|jgi:pyruvate,orthophosphate dikinase|nr:pyruvate, phosphate dikinase [Polyangia bacterium]